MTQKCQFQPGDHVTFELDANDVAKLNDGDWLDNISPDKIRAHTRPGEATPQKREMREVVEKCAHQFRYYEKLHRAKPDHAKADTNAEFALMCEQAAARADLPGPMRSAEELATKYTKTLLIVLRLTTDDEAAIKSVLLEALTAAAAPPEGMVMVPRLATREIEEKITKFFIDRDIPCCTPRAIYREIVSHYALTAAEAPQEGE